MTKETVNWRHWSLTKNDRPKLIELMIALGLFCLAVVAFVVSPVPYGIDWTVFHDAGQRVWTGARLYGEPTSYQFYYNPPWLAVALMPISLLPYRWGWAIVSVVSLFVVIALARRWQLGFVRLCFALLSPPLLYIVAYGQIDALVLGGILLPVWCWPLVASAKPQVAIGLVFGVRREQWVYAVVLTSVVLLASFVLFGSWPLQLIQQPTPLHGAHNLWLGLWPFQVPAGLMLILLGVRRRDERFLVAASPLLSPYAATSSLIGMWLAGMTLLRDWEAGVVWLSWWGVTFYRFWTG
jgi:hypothetical protein